MRHFIIAIWFICCSLAATAQAPQGFSYQAVIRDASGGTLKNSNIFIEAGIMDGPSGPVVYKELHKATTNEYGLVNLKIGQGAALQGDFSQINWAGGSKWLRIAVDMNGSNDFQIVTASELLSVPYAIYAGTAGETNNGADTSASNEIITGITFNPTTGDFSITEAGQTHDVKVNVNADDLSDNKLDDLNDVDAPAPAGGDVLRWNGTKWVSDNGSDFSQQLAIINNILSITGGNSISLAPYMDNTDSQQLTFDPTTHLLTLSNGGNVDLTSLYNPQSPTYNTGLYYDSLSHELTVTDNGTFFTVDLSKLANDSDADPANELIDNFQFDAGTGALSVTDAGGVKQVNLSPLQHGAYLTAASFNAQNNTLTITDNGGTYQIDLSSLLDDADADAGNELQTVSKTGSTVTISHGGGSFTDEVNDADADPANELQTVSKIGTTVTLSNGGGSFVDEVNDADADPANELQTITKTGNTISLSHGGGNIVDEVDDADADPLNEVNQSLVFDPITKQLQLTDAGGTLNTDLQALTSDAYNTGFSFDPATNTLTIADGGNSYAVDLSTLINDADADAGNELQTISKTANMVTLSNGGGSFMDEINDADADAGNELQTLSLNNDTLYLSHGGGAVVLPSPASSTANLAGTDNYLVKFHTNGTAGGNSQIYDNNTAVGIGTTVPAARLHVNAYNGQSPLRIDINGTNKMVITAGGRIGFVNTSSPAYQFDITGADNTLLARSKNTSTSGTGFAGYGNNVNGYLPSGGAGLAGSGYSAGVVGYATNYTNSAFGGYFWNDNIYAYVGGWNMSGGLFTPYKIIGNGTVSTIVTGADGTKKTMFAPEAPEVLFQDYGIGQLNNGKATIQLDADFAQNITVNPDHPLKVYITLEGECNGVYVANKSDNGFEVIELNSGTSDASFSWMVVATRKNEVYTSPDGSKKKASFDVRFPKAPDMMPVVEKQEK